MIRTARQLKALVRNMSKSDSNKAMIIIRNYVMERFLERLAVSPYRDNLILKGDTLVSAMVGLDNRSTMDVDTTVKNLTLTEEKAHEIVSEIISIPLDDGMTFAIASVTTIMDDADYPGVRVQLDTCLETMHTPLKIDFSTDDVITPSEILYVFKLIFEDRTISLLAYNLETVLAEKLETILSRGTLNTRMRDFYDIYVLGISQQDNIDADTLGRALINTAEKRGSLPVIDHVGTTIDEIENSSALQSLWENYRTSFDYAADIQWETIIRAFRQMYDMAVPPR